MRFVDKGVCQGICAALADAFFEGNLKICKSGKNHV